MSIRNLKVIDSTTIQLFSEILRGVGRKPLDGTRRKGGIKVQTMMDAFSGVSEFVRMTEARVHDRKFLYLLKLEPDSWPSSIRLTTYTGSSRSGRSAVCGS